MDAGPEVPRPDNCPRPGRHVVATCDLRSGTHRHLHVVSGTMGEIVRTPAYFTTTYSIRFDVHGTAVTMHGINRHEFRIVDDAGNELDPGFPPINRYPQPLPDLTAVGAAAPEDDAESG